MFYKQPKNDNDESANIIQVVNAEKATEPSTAQYAAIGKALKQNNTAELFGKENWKMLIIADLRAVTLPAVFFDQLENWGQEIANQHLRSSLSWTSVYHSDCQFIAKIY